MAKQSMIQREFKRSRLVKKYAIKRESLKQELKTASSYQSKLELYKKPLDWSSGQSFFIRILWVIFFKLLVIAQLFN